MIWLLAQIWPLAVITFILGFLTTWFLVVRPRQLDAQAQNLGAAPATPIAETALVEDPPAEDDVPVSELDEEREEPLEATESGVAELAEFEELAVEPQPLADETEELVAVDEVAEPAESEELAVVDEVAEPAEFEESVVEPQPLAEEPEMPTTVDDDVTDEVEEYVAVDAEEGFYEPTENVTADTEISAATEASATPDNESADQPEYVEELPRFGEVATEDLYGIPAELDENGRRIIWREELRPSEIVARETAGRQDTDIAAEQWEESDLEDQGVPATDDLSEDVAEAEESLAEEQVAEELAAEEQVTVELAVDDLSEDAPEVEEPVVEELPAEEPEEAPIPPTAAIPINWSALPPLPTRGEWRRAQKEGNTAALESVIDLHRQVEVQEENHDASTAEAVEVAESTAVEKADVEADKPAPAVQAPTSAFMDDALKVLEDPIARRFGPDARSPLEDDYGPPGFPILADGDSQVFHTPDSPRYERAIPLAYFRTEEAARAAGFMHWDRRYR